MIFPCLGLRARKGVESNLDSANIVSFPPGGHLLRRPLPLALLHRAYIQRNRIFRIVSRGSTSSMRSTNDSLMFDVIPISLVQTRGYG